MSATAKVAKSSKQKKAEYFEKLLGLLDKYPKILIVTCDNIGSNHMQRIRLSLRGKAVLLMGKNTMMRRAIRSNLSRNPKWESLLPAIYGNIGFIFTDQDLSGIKDLAMSTRVPASAKANTFAPKDVSIPKGITTLEPTKTSFLQALNIASKITRGTIEILNDVHLIKKSERIGSSEATFLTMLNIKPFEYGLNVTSVYDDGAVYGVEILSLKDSDILAKFGAGIANVAALSLGLNLPTIAAFPHVVMNSYKNMLAIALATDYVFDQAKKLKDIVENPDAFVSTTPVSNTTSNTTQTTVTVAPVVEEKPESEEMEFDLFG